VRISSSLWVGVFGSWFLLLAAISIGHADELNLPTPGPRDTCPVCGMFVAKYPEWVATVAYRDGHAHHFDGAKDLFKYLFDMPRWAPGHRAKDIEAIGVTEYYGLTLIDARHAWYVIGSDVLGPMGHELIPLATADDAEAFLKDHSGARILRFEDVDQDLPTKLDNREFE
jgi:copper chaperone NosL